MDYSRNVIEMYVVGREQKVVTSSSSRYGGWCTTKYIAVGPVALEWACNGLLDYQPAVSS